MIKILLINGLFSLPPLLYYVMGEDATPHPSETSGNITMKRYVVENEYLPPIFGSFKYNAILQQFDLPETVHSTTTTVKAPADALRTHSGFMDYERAKLRATGHSMVKVKVVAAAAATDSKTTPKKTTPAKIITVVKGSDQSIKSNMTGINQP